ncbi:MAG: aldehyde ferredoxin oxidoreductase family protein [Syntrophothermus sp.]
MHGYQGKILQVNLTSGQIDAVALDEKTRRDFAGGSGIAAKLFFDRIGKQISVLDPIGPDNPLIFMTGPLVGTPVPSTGRMTASAKSPLTGIWGESSVGGFFGAELKFAGYDGILLEGQAPRPVYLEINDGQAHLVPVEEWWGKDAYETIDGLAEKTAAASRDGSSDEFAGGSAAGERSAAAKRKPQIIAIGQAGENLVPYAAIVHNKGHLLGRTGMGAVMGSKRLKAVVVRGTGIVQVADEDAVRNLRSRLLEKMKNSILIEALHAFGTNSSMDLGSLSGDVPVKNWQLGAWEGSERINGASFSDKVLVGAKTCYGCPVACKREVAVKDGPFRMEKGPGPEYETVGAFGTMCLNDNVEAICKLNELCNRYGMDTITAGSTIAFAIECFEDGLLTPAQTDGLTLRWGDPELLVELVHLIGKGEGFGKKLALGSRRLAAEIGPEAAEKLSTVKGLEAPMHDPRAGHGMGLAYATSIRGACHVSSLTMGVEQGAAIYPGLGLDGMYQGMESAGKAEMVVKTQNLGMIMSGAAIICQLAGMIYDDADLVEALNAVTGIPWTLEELMEAGDRIWNLKRLIGSLSGAGREDDKLPGRLLTPTAEGGAAGSVPDMDLMLEEFYALREIGADGRPSRSRLEKLSLKEAADLLDKIKRESPS